MNSIWAYPAEIGQQHQPLTGFSVTGRDGVIGHVDRQMDRPGRQHLVVDTGMWIFGESVLVPAGFVTGIDHATRTVTVDRSKDQIHAAPRFVTDKQTSDSSYLAEVGAYYASLGVPVAG
ncbi:PRC-barrel domain containing protein [Streptomyces sp. NPDC020742]|uniref:PRC-barrel domain containing protein n=1 Tax=Streptomyces sp. NPDC020742 TaxID=3154897 RepID=UPI0033F2388A